MSLDMPQQKNSDELVHKVLPAVTSVQRQVSEIKRITHILTQDLERFSAAEQSPVFELLSFLFDSQDFMTVEIIGHDLKPMYANAALRQLVEKFGGSLSKEVPCYTSFWNRKNFCGQCPIEEVLELGEMKKVRFFCEELEEFYEFIFVPLRDNGTKAVLVMGHKTMVESGGQENARECPDT